MRIPRWLPLCGLLVLGACAEAPQQPPSSSGPTARAAPDDATAAAIANHRQSAQRHAQAGDHAAAAQEWRIVLLLAPADAVARAQLDAEREAIRQGVRDNLQAGLTAARNGDTDRAMQAMLRVLALDPENAEAAKVLRDIDRQKLTRIQNSQSLRAARETQGTVAATSRTPPAPASGSDPGDTYDLEQPIEMFKAGDINGGLRDFRAFVDANPRNDPARLRIATIVYDRGVESDQKGSREQALMLVDQAVSLRGKPVPEWSARGLVLRKSLSGEYYDRGVQAYPTDVPGAIRLWETSVKYDPQNRAAQAKLEEARAALAKLKRVERDRTTP
jgi:tetratricopeptide (TPR) repeat protein